MATTSTLLPHRQTSVSVSGATVVPRQAKMHANSSLRGTRSISRSDLLVVTTQLSIMCQSGVDLAAAMTNIAKECRHPSFKQILQSVSADVNSGLSASTAMGKFASTFGDAFVASIAAAEASGTMTTVLQRLCDSLKNEIRLRNQIRAIVAYPIVLIVIASVVIGALVFFVLPQFGKVFQNGGRPAPPFTRLLLDSATFLREQSHWLVAVVAVVSLGLFRLSRTESSRRYFDHLVLHAPLLRDATRSLLTGRTFRLLGALLESGVPLLTGIRLCRGAVKNRLFVEMFDNLEREVTNGRGLSGEITRSEFVPSGAAQMVQTAEHSGRLGPVLQLIGEHYEEQGEQLIKSAMKVVEPAVIVVMGIIVGGIVISVMLPMLDVTTTGN